MPKESACLKVHKTLGQKTLAYVGRLGLADKALQIQRDKEGFLFIPLIRGLSASEEADLKRQLPEAQLTTHVFPEKMCRQQTISEALADKLPSHLRPFVPRALDIIGDIAVIEVPSELEEYKHLLGEAIFDAHPGIQVVLAKAGKVSGTYRLRDFEFIAGEKRTDTLYRENGCSYYVDVGKAYFSPRLGHERRRVAELVEDGETVLDLFAGVGPFAVLIAKTCKTARVYAVDINPEAIELLKKNAKVNRVADRISAFIGDSRQIVMDELSGLADRVIMNLPETAIQFVGAACQALKSSGGVVHFYGFVREPETIEELKLRFVELVENEGRKVAAFNHMRNVRETAPYEFQVVLDAKIR